jgi:hypothetical protein
MPDDPAPTPPPEDAPEPRRLAPQDERLLADIADMERSLEAARDDADVQELIAPLGFDSDDLDARLALVAAVQAGVTARAEAMAAEDRAVTAKQADYEAQAGAYSVFRQVARALFRDEPDALVALNLNGETPDALDEFVAHARTAYANGRIAPYAARLAVRQYDDDRLRTTLTDLEKLLVAAERATTAEARAVEATNARDAAARDARRAFAEFRATVRPILAHYPELLRRIGL